MEEREGEQMKKIKRNAIVEIKSYKKLHEMKSE
jgi:hypothetical protein